MNFTTYKTTLQKTLSQKNIALRACAGLVMSNLVLTLKVVSGEERWVLTPQNNIDHKIPITSSKYSDEYFIEWASNIVNTLLCVNPESYEWKIRQILAITTEKHGTLKDQLTQEGLRIEKEQISTVFYPQSFEVTQGDQSIEVTGQHITYFGKRSTPVETQKTFHLSWIVSSNGVILLKDFKELKDE